MMTERESVGGVVVVDPLGGLVLDPANELRFKGPFDDYVTVSLVIKNPTEKRIAFKIKTTAPKRYCVKPNSGVLDSGQSMKVNVLLQPFNYDPNEKNKHKFMVQYLYLNDEEINLGVNEILNMWKDVPVNRLLDMKLRCLFEITEAEQQRLAQQQPIPNEQVTSSTTTTTTTNVQQQQQNSKSLDQEVKPVSVGTQAQKTTPITTNQSVSAKSVTTNIQPTTSPTPTPSTTTTTSTNKLTDADTFTKDFDSTNVNNVKSSLSRQSTDKNDNLLNEMKLVKQENENLKKEVARLKEEESRLRKLALTAPVSSMSSHNLANETTIFADLLNNRLVLIIVVLIAIILYLLLFR